jgi:ssDNA-binding Zn-finger/Zn-ribbon topoisomerase 1
MIQAVCPKCGAFYHGWSLLNPRHQSCTKCGSALDISDGKTVFRGYSPFDEASNTESKPSDSSLAFGRESYRSEEDKEG